MIWYWTGNLVILASIAFLCYKKLNYPFTQPFFYPALILKLLAGIGVGLIYTYYYRNGDTIRFQLLANQLSNLANGNLKDYFLFIIQGGPSHHYSTLLGLAEEPRTLYFVKILSLLNFITGGNYWLNSLYFSLSGFMGAWFIIYSLSGIGQKYFLPAYIPFALFPSIVFWSSGVLKESIAFFCMGLMTFIFLDFYINRKGGIVSVILFLCAGWIYWNVKYYFVVILVICMLSVILTDIISSRINSKQLPFIMAMIFLILAFAGSFLHPNFSLGRIIGILHENHMKILTLSQNRNAVPFIPVYSPSLSLLINLPLALLAGLFMPLPFQGSGFLTIAPGLINLMVLLATMILIFRGIYFPRGRLRFLLYGLILYIITLATLLSYSTPNFGTLERYEVSYLPFYIFIILAGLWPRFRGSVFITEKT